MEEIRSRPLTRETRQLPFLVSALIIASLGCGDASRTANPGPVDTTHYNSYFGTQSIAGQINAIGNAQVVFGGAWNITLDDNSHYFSYDDFSLVPVLPGYYWSQQIQGSLQAAGGFLEFKPNNLNAAQSKYGVGGYALEVPGDVAVVRPGPASVAPVIAVATSGCQQLLANSSYQFIALGTPFTNDMTTHVAYGSIDAATSGTTWNFSNYKMYALDGSAIDQAALPAGGCSVSQGGYAVSVPYSAATNNETNSAAISPNGYFVLDQGQGDGSFYSATMGALPLANGPLGLIGVQTPSSALDTGKLVAAKYLGYQYDPIQDTNLLDGTLPVSFGAQTAGSGTIITGGAFANGDPTMMAAADTTIDLGQQDSSTPGLFKAVTVTVPDRFNGCVQQAFGGTDSSGNPTCIFHGIAIAGDPNNKFVIFVTVNDLGEQSRGDTPLATLHFFLYQQ